MASPHLYLSNNPSMMYIVRPTLVILPKSPQKDNKGGDQGEEQGEKMEPQSKCHEVKTNFDITLPVSSSSSSSSPTSQDSDDSKIREEEVNKKETTSTTTTTSSKEDDEDDGYQTPTSPRHKIPPFLECPKAPMKKKPTSCRRRGMKRGRELWGCFEIMNIVEFGDDLSHPNKPKKVRREAAFAEQG